MDTDRVLIIDDDVETSTFLQGAFVEAGLEAETVTDAFAAMEKLRDRTYAAVVLDPMIRHRLNGYAVLNFIELEQPEMVERLFLLTGMSEQTIRRTVPSVLPRLFRKPSAAMKAVTAVLATCAPSGSREQAMNKGSVLLVEDDRMTASATQGMLEELGYAVEWAPNGREAFDALAARTFDVIMLDLVMPHVDGFMVLEHFRSEKPGLLRRVIVTTGIPEKYVQILDQSTIRCVLQKPLDVRRLEHLLLDCIKREEVPFQAGGEAPYLG
jgi:DNA-binding NtrC family response regulator